MLGDDEISEMQEHIDKLQKELDEKKRTLNAKKLGGLYAAVEARKKADGAILEELKKLGYPSYPWL